MQQELSQISDMSEAARKLEYHLDLRGFSNKTKEAYIYQVKKFLLYIKKPAKLVNLTDARKYVLNLLDKKKTNNSINLAISAIRFLYLHVWNRKSFYELKGLKKEKRVPTVIPKEDIEKMINALPNVKHKLLLELLYSSGVRISEAVKMKLSDLRIEEKIAKVCLGKGAKDRYVILSDRFIKRFVEYIFERSTKGVKSEYVFENKVSHITTRTGEEIINNAARIADISYNVFPHAFRSSFATHLYDAGTGVFDIQKLMGHESIDSTQVYVATSTENMKRITSPMDC